MKKTIIILFAYFSIFSCSSNDDDITEVVTTPVVVENKINLTSNYYDTTETVNLSWTLNGNNNTTYDHYKIVRSDSQNGQQVELGNNSPNQFTFTSTVPFSPYLEYQIIGIKSNGEQVKSNIVKIERPEIKLLNLKTFDAQFDKNSGKLYLLDTDGKIAIYDVNTGSVTHQINTNAVLGYSDLGVYNGNTELYVARKDGWVDIYDGNDLTLKDQVNFGMQLVSTIYHNGKLYGSATNYEIIKAIDRTSKTLVSQSPQLYSNSGRMRKSVGTSVKLYTITQNISPVDMDLYNFDLNGNYVNHQDDAYHGDHPLNYRIFETFPDGRVITSSSGSVYNSQMTYLNNLPSGNSRLTSFDFDSNSIIAGTMSKTIEFYNINSYTKTQTINTKKYPFKVFSYNNKVVSVSSVTQLNVQDYYYSNVIPENVMIEVFNK